MTTATIITAIFAFVLSLGGAIAAWLAGRKAGSTDERQKQIDARDRQSARVEAIDTGAEKTRERRDDEIARAADARAKVPPSLPDARAALERAKRGPK